MGLQLPRKKRRNIKLSLAYRLNHLMPFSGRRKLKLYLDLAWIFSRLAHEESIKMGMTPNHQQEDFIASFIEKDASVLDIGCGNGSVIARIKGKTENILGVDYDRLAIDAAKKRFKNTRVKLTCEDIFEYMKQHPHLKFDYVILSHVLEHIENPQSFLKALIPYSRYFYIELPDFEASYLNVLRVNVDTDLVYVDADHVSEFDRKELVALLGQCGLTVIQSEFRFGVLKFWCERNSEA